MQTLTKLQLSNLSIFSPRTQRIKTTIFKDLFRKDNYNSKKHSVPQKKRINNFTLPHKFRYRFRNLYDDESPLYQQETPNRKYLKPLRNAIAKIVEMRRQQLPRRKSAHGELFGEITQKEMSNLPTIIQQHKEVNKQELALASFAIMLERKQRKQTTRKLSRKLSKQESLVEYDNMERPPSCVTPPKLNLIPKPKPKSKIQLEKEKYFKSQDLKMGHFLTSRLYKQSQPSIINFQQNSESIKFPSHGPSFNSLPNIHSFVSSPKMLTIIKQQQSLANIQESNQTIKTTTTRSRPYKKHNILLLKKIQQTFEYKNISSSTQKQISIDRKQF